MLPLALAIAPGLAVVIFIFLQVRRREPVANMLMAVAGGMACTFAASFIEHRIDPHIGSNVGGIILSSFVGIALVEELCKFCILLFLCYPRKSFDEPLDGIIYAVLVGMGFATLENIYYVRMHGVEVAFLRMFTSFPGHATFGVIMGYHIGKAKFNEARRTRLMITGIAAATLAHGVYDSFLLLSENHWLKRYVSDLLLLSGALFSLFICISLSRRLIQLHTLTSQRYQKKIPMYTIRRAEKEDVPLIRELAWKVWPHTYAGINPPDQIEYMMELIYSETSLQNQMAKGHIFLLIYDEENAAGFSSYSQDTPTGYKLQKIYALPEYQGRGAGKFLLDYIISDIRSRGGTTLSLNVNRHNKARSFYEKMGFTIKSEEDVDIGNGYYMFDYVMEKQL
jgi:RsiW-degrading membrane proteinase PrsW (M82 family)/ribosomal protein S18 acetylase RimI-like enzyme